MILILQYILMQQYWENAKKEKENVHNYCSDRAFCDKFVTKCNSLILYINRKTTFIW